MRTLVRSSFVRLFGAGFVLGAVGLVALQPIEGRQALAGHFAHSTIAHR